MQPVIHTLDEAQSQQLIDRINEEIKKKKSASDILGVIGGLVSTAAKFF